MNDRQERESLAQLALGGAVLAFIFLLIVIGLPLVVAIGTGYPQ